MLQFKLHENLLIIRPIIDPGAKKNHGAHLGGHKVEEHHGWVDGDGDSSRGRWVGNSPPRAINRHVLCIAHK